MSKQQVPPVSFVLTQGLKPSFDLAFAARLKSCPDTKHEHEIAAKTYGFCNRGRMIPPSSANQRFLRDAVDLFSGQGLLCFAGGNQDRWVAKAGIDDRGYDRSHERRDNKHP